MWIHAYFLSRHYSLNGGSSKLEIVLQVTLFGGTVTFILEAIWGKQVGMAESKLGNFPALDFQ